MGLAVGDTIDGKPIRAKTVKKYIQAFDRYCTTVGRRDESVLYTSTNKIFGPTYKLLQELQ